MEFSKTILQAWKVMENSPGHGKSWRVTMAAWIKMPLGMELGLGPGNSVLDGDPTSPPQKGAEPPLIFG